MIQNHIGLTLDLVVCLLHFCSVCSEGGGEGGPLGRCGGGGGGTSCPIP